MQWLGGLKDERCEGDPDRVLFGSVTTRDGSWRNEVSNLRTPNSLSNMALFCTGNLPKNGLLKRGRESGRGAGS